MTVNFDKIGEVLKKYRKMRGNTQQELGDLLGVSRVAYANFERGISILDVQKLAILANYLQISLVELLTGASEEGEIIRLTQALAQEIQQKLDGHSARA